MSANVAGAGRSGMTRVREHAFLDLCRDFDPLLEPDAVAAPDAVRAQLATFAQVFDLDLNEAPAGDIWRHVRPILATHYGVDELGLASTEPVDFHPKVYLPVDRGSQTDRPYFGEAVSALSLMIVEDDRDLAMNMIDLLTDAGHRVVAHAGTADMAATQAALHDIDLAIVDVELADGSSGVDLARLLSDRWSVPVLFVSGGRNEHLVTFESAVGFLGKPFKSAELLAAITLAAPLLRRG